MREKEKNESYFIKRSGFACHLSAIQNTWIDSKRFTIVLYYQQNNCFYH